MFLISSANSWRRVEWDHLHCLRIRVHQNTNIYKILYMSQINQSGNYIWNKTSAWLRKMLYFAKLVVSSLQLYKSNIKTWVQSSQYNFIINKQIWNKTLLNSVIFRQKWVVSVCIQRRAITIISLSTSPWEISGQAQLAGCSPWMRTNFSLLNSQAHFRGAKSCVLDHIPFPLSPFWCLKVRSYSSSILDLLNVFYYIAVFSRLFYPTFACPAEIILALQVDW